MRAKAMGLSKAKAGEVVDSRFDCRPGTGIISIELARGRKVSTIPDFGAFPATPRKAREGLNPATGKTVRIAADTYPAFKAGKTLSGRVAQ